ncbi:MAG: fatty acid desaturase [Gemmatimonadaceae bacterium]
MPIPAPPHASAPVDGSTVPEHRSWRRTLFRYHATGTRQAVEQLLLTLLPLVAGFWLMERSVDVSYWLTLALAVPTAGFLVRAFIVMHDCAHGSFVESRRGNEIIGFATAVLTLTPFTHWRREHALHHAGSGDLDRRGHGDIFTLTKEEYLARTPWGRLKYRMYRHPLVQFGVGPLYVLVIRWWQLVHSAVAGGNGTRAQVLDAGILLTVIGLALAVGGRTLLLVYVPPFLLAAATGIWLSHVQHQFDETYWERHEDWDYSAAALQGSSHYRLPRALEWLTGSIGLHHVHHLDPKIPSYNLRRCHDENSREFSVAPELTLRESLATPSLRVWDTEQRRLVPFAAMTPNRGGAPEAPPGHPPPPRSL